MNSNPPHAPIDRGIAHQIVARDQDWCAGSVSNVVVACWWGETSAASVRLLGELIASTGARYPAGIGLIQIVGASAVAPSTDVRGDLAGMLRAGAPHLKGSSIVVQGGGFRYAAARAMVSALALVARLKYPHIVHPSIADSVHWLGQLFREARAWQCDKESMVRLIEAMSVPEVR